jgi:16S rRNA (adenine1518-N6/adenine1519-N6)-dimethyltransferase
MCSSLNLSSPTVINNLLKRHNLRPQKRFGQNFLVDANILRRIVEVGKVGEKDQVFEIGAGLGVLTQALSKAVGEEGKVISVECDSHLLPALAETLEGFPQASVIEADVMSLNLTTELPRLFDTSRPIKVIANIPYQITSPLIAALIEQKHLISEMVFLVQKEVALRLCATVETGDYGAFSLYCQYHTVIESLFNVPKTVFYPQPEVTSAVIRLSPRKTPAVEVIDESLFFAVIRSASDNEALGWSKERTAEILGKANIDPIRRGETLSIEKFAEIANHASASSG